MALKCIMQFFSTALVFGCCSRISLFDCASPTILPTREGWHYSLGVADRIQLAPVIVVKTLPYVQQESWEKRESCELLIPSFPPLSSPILPHCRLSKLQELLILSTLPLLSSESDFNYNFHSGEDQHGSALVISYYPQQLKTYLRHG